MICCIHMFVEFIVLSTMCIGFLVLLSVWPQSCDEELEELQVPNSLTGWLASWLVGWLVAWWVGWLADWLVGWLAGCLLGWLIAFWLPLGCFLVV